MTTFLKMPTVSNFLCYFDLSTGGKILGWMDCVLYSITLLFLIINMFLGMTIIDRDELNNFTVLGLVIDAVVQLVLLFLFILMSLSFLKGIQDRSPKKCLPFVILGGIQVVVTLLHGLVYLSPGWLIFAGIKIYFFIVEYSLYVLFTYGDEQAAYEAHQTANSAGYEQYYEPDGYNNIDNQEESGYQTTEFKGA